MPRGERGKNCGRSRAVGAHLGRLRPALQRAAELHQLLARLDGIFGAGVQPPERLGQRRNLRGAPVADRRECRREISQARRDNWRDRRDDRYYRYDRYGYGYGDRYGYRGW